MLQTSALDDYGAGRNLSIYQDDSLASAHAAEQLVSAGSMTAATPFDWTRAARTLFPAQENATAGATVARRSDGICGRITMTGIYALGTFSSTGTIRWPGVIRTSTSSR
jgi:hypothetical protein